MKNELMFNYLHGTDIWLYQRKDMFRVNTDTSLLGNFMKVYPKEWVLDIGTNNGALLLYASQYTKGKLIGVDVTEEAIALAKKNLDYNHIEDYQLYLCPIQELELDPVDVIVCNPPYFPVSEHMNENPFLQVARHEVKLSLDELCKHMSRLLKESGRGYLVHRAIREEEIIQSLRAYGLYVHTKQLMYDENREDAVSLLLEVQKIETEVNVLEPIRLCR